MDIAIIYIIYQIIKQQSKKKKEQEESTQSPDSFESLFQFGSLRTADAETVEKTQEKYQGNLCGLMSMYQAYHTLLWLKQEENYATRGSVIKCQYGTKSARLDCLMDHGVIMGNLPVMTCTDCRSTNIHNFGSCMCPENRYRGRLPMTASVHPNGQPAEKLAGNEYAHICVPMITEPWLQTGGKIEIVDKEVVAHALLKEASLTCLYGGRIQIVEVPRQEEPPKEELEWIPSNVMQIDGNKDSEKMLKYHIDTLNGKIKDKTLMWNQDKIDYVWEICNEFYENYGVQVDPRILVAIVCSEGTGSFDTSIENKAGDGGNGPESDFALDCKKAIDIVGGKIIAYTQFHDEFDAMVKGSSSYRGLEETRADILTYTNWETPRLCLNTNKFESGVYADDNHWNGKVRYIYSKFFEKEDSSLYGGRETDAYSTYIRDLPQDLFSSIANENNINVSGEVVFSLSQNGRDSLNKPNGEYTIIGTIK